MKQKLFSRSITRTGYVLATACVLLAMTSTAALGQTSSIRAQMAELSQRFTELEQQYNQLKLEVSILTIQNNKLTRELEQLREQGMNNDVQAAVDAQLSNHQKSTEAFVKEQYEKIMRLLASRVGTAETERITTTASTPTTTVTSSAISFGDNFPRSGHVYTVQSGDTLSRIAARFGSTVKFIQDANQISDPNTVRVGQKLFIPVAKD